MTKVVINRCYGGFGLSDEAFERLLNAKGIAFEKTGSKWGGTDYWHLGHVDEDEFYLSHYDFTRFDKRADQDLIRIVEEMGEQSWGRFSELEIVDVPDDVEWDVCEYDGNEWIAEKHRTWP